jgi:ferritin-like metal-binding protein YciE
MTATSIERAERTDAQRISGISNVTYDLISTLHEKLKAVAAYDIYRADAKKEGHKQAESFFDECLQQERAACEQLRDMLAQSLQSGAPNAGKSSSTPSAGNGPR